MTGALHRRAPLLAFAAVQIIAFVTWFTVGRSNWFYIDEWDFLADRKAGNVDDLFRSHNGHWTTLPVLAFRFVFVLFGLRTYVPYRALIIVLYLACAALLLVVMRRAGVHPWIATAAASLFALFGAGWENIILPFQITFTGSFFFGLAFLLFADHDGPYDRRDLLGATAGLLGLMCSGIGIVMVAVVGLAVVIRRGWRLALFHVVPLAAAYSLWLMAIGSRDSALGHFDAGTVARFVATGARAAFGAIGPFAGFGVVVAIVLVGGCALAWEQRRGSSGMRELAAPTALVTGAFLVLAITAVNRSSFGADWARQSRYVSLVSAMTLPALAVAADAVARRWRWFLPVAIGMFLVGVPANIHAANRAQRVLNARDAATKATMLSIPRDPFAREVPRSLRPEPTTASAVTIGWLLDTDEQGRLPDADRAGEVSPRLQASNDFRLSFARVRGVPPATNCLPLHGSVELELHRGDRIGLYGDGAFFAPASEKLVGLEPLFAPADHEQVAVLRDVGRVPSDP